MIREQPDAKVEIARVCENQASVSESLGLRGWQPIDGMTAAWNMRLHSRYICGWGSIHELSHQNEGGV